jgi:mannose-6-phosphate isomerase-like protein (cupin superfamily)
MNSPDSSAEKLRVGGDLLEVRMSSEESDGALFAYDVSLAPGGGPPHLHRHEAVEVFKVEQGELTFYLADHDGEVDRRTAGPGEVVAIPGDREHTIRNEAAAAARAFAILSPGDRMEHFARAAAALGADATPARVSALAADNGIEITRPLPHGPSPSSPRLPSRKARSEGEWTNRSARS